MYAMEIYFRQCWIDKRLRFDPADARQKEIKVSVSILRRIWRPDTYFVNGKGSRLHEITVPNKLLRIQADGTVFFSMRLTVKALCHMDFRRFPVDSQTCLLMIGSFAYDSRNLVYLWWEEARLSSHLYGIPPTIVNSSNKNLGFEVTAMAQFLFRPDLVQFSHSEALVGKEVRNMLSMTIPLERMIGFYVLQIYLPSYMTVAMSWVSFWINREATPARVTLGITALLTSVTITLTGRMGLPKVPYATAMDIFLLICFFFVFSALLEYAGVNYFTKAGNVEIPRRIDDATPANGGRGGVHGDGNSCLRMFADCLRGDRRYAPIRSGGGGGGGGGWPSSESVSGPNSESKIDRAARCLFPVSFVAVNMAYWLVLFRAGS
uniref:Neur_chan_LBD domain-containing protein n=1 Tax=Macrostomum lignano TaxID=282301 RepID=A0A1I8HU03_9PLAT